MKKLIKPIKKTEVFEDQKVSAFHNNNGEYCEGSSYSRNDYGRGGSYLNCDCVDSEDNILF